MQVSTPTVKSTSMSERLVLVYRTKLKKRKNNVDFNKSYIKNKIEYKKNLNFDKICNNNKGNDYFVFDC